MCIVPKAGVSKHVARSGKDLEPLMLLPVLPTRIDMLFRSFKIIRCPHFVHNRLDNHIFIPEHLCDDSRSHRSSRRAALVLGVVLFRV